MNYQSAKKTSYISLILKTLAFFIFIYSFPIFAGATDGFTGRITSTLIILIIILIVKIFRGKKIEIHLKNKNKNGFSSIYSLVIFITLYVLLLLLIFGFGNGTTYLGFLLNFLVLAPLSYFAFNGFFKSVEEFWKVVLYATLLQCFFIVLAIFSTPFATVLSNFFTPRGNYDYMQLRSGGYNVGFACVTSYGAMQVSLGIVSCVYFIIKKKNNWLYFVLFGIITFAMTAVARTGLFVSIVGLVFVLLLGNKKNNFKGLAITAIPFLILTSLFLFRSGEITFDSIFKRLIVLNENGLYAGFFEKYYFHESTIIPPISFETIIGTGIVSGTSGNGITINADGGFFRTYVACGLPIAIFFYLFVCYQIIKETKLLNNKSEKITMIFMLVCLLIGEFKEPFIIFRFYYLVIIFIFSSTSKHEIFRIDMDHFNNQTNLILSREQSLNPNQNLHVF